MLISIVIPTHNEAKYIDGCLSAIFEKINKVKIEVIVVDNGSTDITEEIVTSYNCKLINIKGQVFPGVARNVGFENSSGEIIAFIDADIEISDSWANQLERLLRLKDKDLNDLFVGAPYGLSTDPGWIEKYWFASNKNRKIDYINGGNIIISRRAFKKVGGFNESFETGEDVEFSCRARTKGIVPVFNHNWKVFHEGYPKGVLSFIIREKWHGKGDFVSFKQFTSSKIAISTAVFLILHIMLAALLLSGGACSSLTKIAFSMVFLMCFLFSWRQVGLSNFLNFILSPLLAYVYFIGRSISLVESVKVRLLYSIENSIKPRNDTNGKKENY